MRRPAATAGVGWAVARAGSFLSRFRRLVAPPGRPSEALGVPASGEDVEAELAPLLAEADQIDDLAAQIEAAARAQAQRVRDHAQRDAAAILATARDRADAERVRAAAAIRAQGRRDAERVHEAAQAEAARIRAGGEEALAELLSTVVACVRDSGR